VLDSRIGLPMDAAYPRELAALRAPGRRLAEVGALSVAPAHRRTGLVHLVNKLMMRVARECLAVDDLVIAVHPRAEDFYRGALLFERVGAPRVYPGLTAQALAVALKLDLATLRARYLRAYGPAPASAANAYHFYFVATHPQLVMPRGAPSIERRLPARRAAARELLARRRESLESTTPDARAFLAAALEPPPPPRET
jgi:hypothetical protein